MKSWLWVALVFVAAGCRDFQRAYDDCVDGGGCNPANPGSGGGGGNGTGGGGGSQSDGGALTLNATPTTLNFGRVALNDTASLPFTLLNQGSVAADLVNLSTTVPYVVSANACPPLLGAGQSCTVSVSFSPAVVGASVGALSFGSTVLVQLSAQGVDRWEVSPPTHSFGNLNTGVASAPFIFHFTNNLQTGSGPISFDTGSPAFPFDAGSCSSGIDAGLGCDVAVFFAPTGASSFVGALSLTRSVTVEIAAALTGNGLAAAALSLNPTSLDFGPGLDAGDSVRKTVTVHNNGATASGPLQIYLDDGGTLPYVQLNFGSCVGMPSLPADGGCNFSVVFAPPAGQYTVLQSELNVVASPGGRVVGPLTGKGLEELNLSVTPSTGGAVKVGSQNCAGMSCNYLIRRNDSVSLFAIPDPGFSFGQWSDDCAGFGINCVLTMDGRKKTNAAFQMGSVQLQVTNNAKVRVTSTPGGIDCGGGFNNCTAGFSTGARIELDALGTLGNWFQGWSGACTGQEPCKLTLNANANVGTNSAAVNVAFVTNDTFTIADLALGQATADLHCTAIATDAGLPGNYLAWLSSATSSAVGHLGGAQGWVRVDGMPLANTAAQLSTGTLYTPLNLSEKGTHVTGNVWSATSFGLYDGLDCENWRATSTKTFSPGHTEYVDPTWSSGESTVSCQGAAEHLYCFGKNQTTVVVPTLPTGARRAFVARANITGDLSDTVVTQICNDEATDAGMTRSGQVFRPFRASKGNSALDKFSLLTGTWYRVDGVPLVTDLSAITGVSFSGWNTAVALDANGKPTAQRYVWTGAKHPGDAINGPSLPSDGCGTSASGTAWSDSTLNGIYGSPLRTDSTYNFGQTTCNSKLGVYCFEQ